MQTLTHLAEGRSTLEQAIHLQLDMRFTLNQLGENERILEHLREAERLAEALDDQLRLGRVAAYLTTYFYAAGDQDRKSTRLNSSHSQISYAVFCLKKKKK